MKYLSRAAGLLILGGLVSAAQAGVVRNTPTGISTVSQAIYLYWDMLSGATSLTAFGAVGNFGLSDHGDFHYTVPAQMVKLGATDGADVLPVGTTIGPASNFTGSSFAGTTDFGGETVLGQPSYFGLTFQNAGFTYYGWVQITENTSTQTLNAWAYESQPGTPILAGAIPEPSTSIALGLGGLGLAMLRRRAGR